MNFDQLVRQYRPVVRAAILKFSNGWVRADDLPDIEQEVWVRLLRAMASDSARYNAERGALTTYFYMVTRSVCLNIFEKNGRDPSNLALRLEVAATGAPLAVTASNIPSLRDEEPETRLVMADTLAKLKTAAAQTEDAARLLSRYVEACEQLPGPATERRVAKAMGVPVKLVRQARAQARSLLVALGA